VNKRLISVLAFALVVSAGASYVLYRVISQQLTARAETTGRVVVASINLENGALIREGDVHVVDWTGPIPQGAVTIPEDAVGRGVLQMILAGEPLVESRLAPKGAGAGLAASIPPGMRAVAVRTNDVVGVAGFVTPGMHVDILIAGTPPGGSPTAGTLTKTLLQNVEVLSAGQNIVKDNEGKPQSVSVVNMLVTPEQAEILSLASNETRIQFVLRNPTDKEVTRTAGTAMAYLFSGGAPQPKPITVPARIVAKRAPPPQPPAPPPPPPIVTERVVVPITVEVYHGAAKAEAKFKEDKEKEKESRREP
jgi:pilus assembly protein CpaB